ncbi:MAG TPA: beta-ketoacyl-[acyl-carrier-protein] synthase family protein [Syntrophales bacterium]|nr:beta-ketoacyl-[acyl-carrier-protein] synthase family protein [Syntrophales bacterium]
MKRRVVITSVGIVSSLGRNREEIIKSFKERKVNFERPSFDNEIVIAPIKDFKVRDYTGPFKNGRYLNRGAQFAVASAIAATKNSGCKNGDLAEAGLFVGAGPNLDIGGEFPEIREGKIDRDDLQALWILKFLPNTAASVIAKLSGIHGENLTVCTACSASLQAVGEAFRKIKTGYLDRALAGGGDSRLSPGGILAYRKASALYAGDSEPATASRPFDCNRGGFVPGEGGAFFLLEELEKAKERGAQIYGEICGYGSSMNASNMTAPEGTGRWGIMAVFSALQEAEMSPSQVDVISTHGTGTLLNDEGEANLIGEIYSGCDPQVIALKSWIGHTASACGALELALSLICMQENYIPEIRNLKDPCRGKINFVRNGASFSFGTYVIENFGFGGQNGALIVKRFKDV